MVSAFDLEKLQALLKDFYLLTKIRITVFDDHFHELIAYPKQLSTFCQLVRKDPEAHKACIQCDRLACRDVARQKKTLTYQCHAGLTESIAPLCMGNIVIGYLFFGQIFSYSSQSEGWDHIMDCCRSYQLDLHALRDACFSRPVIRPEYLDAAAHIMTAVASYMCLERMAYMKYEDLPAKLDAYISQHFTENIDVSHLCEIFNIGKTPLYELSSQLYGKGIAEHIRHLRIEKAKTLLEENPDIRINEVCEQCGFSDYNYFITVFRRMTGMPPKQYQKTLL